MKGSQMVGMLQKEKLASSAFPIPSRPWRARRSTTPGWKRTIEEIASGASDMLGLWSDGSNVYLGVFEKDTVRIVSFDCGAEKSYPAVGYLHPPAIRLEKAIRDLFGLEAEGATDRAAGSTMAAGASVIPEPGRSRSPRRATVTNSARSRARPSIRYRWDPVHAGIIEPGHFRFRPTAKWCPRLEERLGFVHKGVNQLMAGTRPSRTPQKSRRASPATAPSPMPRLRAGGRGRARDRGSRARDAWLRALMAEIERLANHFGDIGGICNDASFSLMLAHCGVMSRGNPEGAAACFGHRLMMDRVIPGGVVADLTPEGAQALRELLEWITAMVPRLVSLFGDTTSLQDRTVGAGVLSGELARQYACGGYVGRASGRRFDARLTVGYAPYDQLSFEMGGSEDGDVDARVWVRFDEVKASLQIIEQILDRLPHGELATKVDASRAEGRRRGARRRFPRRRLRLAAHRKGRHSLRAHFGTRPGSSGPCSRPRSRATSSPTSLSATNPSTAPTRGMTCKLAKRCGNFSFKACFAAR